MKVIVLGAGVIGVCTAWYLRKAGHDVVVIDRRAEAGDETSYANAGEISPGYSTPWAAPGIPLKAARWVFEKHAPLIIHPRVDKAWTARFLLNCNSASYAVNKSRMMRIANYSRDCLINLREELNISYDERSLGTLQVFRKSSQMAAVEKDIRVLEKDGVRHELLDVAGCVRAEPALAATKNLILGGLRLPDDETGDCKKFTVSLARKCEEAGVRFMYNTKILGLDYLTENSVQGVIIEDEEGRAASLNADRTIVCLGSFSKTFLREAEINIPVTPVKGYSLTYQIEKQDNAPVSTVMDETYKVAITRLGSRVRVGGLAELAGFDLSLNPKRKATLIKSVGDLFPKAGAHDEADFWCGLRPMTPDGTPIIGPTKINGLWLNTGHGTLGWTMAAGSGRVISDLMSGKPPEIETKDLSLTRYGRR